MSDLFEIQKNPFISAKKTTWCPGCGNFGILDALNQVLFEMGFSPNEVLMISGIGQAAKLPHYIKAHGFNTLHGRALPATLGAHVANKDLKIIVNSGDGDSYGEGGNHFLHNVRRNLDIVHMVHNNQVYGLTKGQGSPTTPLGQATRLQFDGMRSDALNPVSLAISLECSFVARSFSGDVPHLKSIIKAALEHKGYAMIDILQPCISFNKINTFKWYKDRVFKLPETYDPTDVKAAYEMSLRYGDEGIPIGILYKKEKVDFLSRIEHIKEPLVSYDRSPTVIESILDGMV